MYRRGARVTLLLLLLASTAAAAFVLVTLEARSVSSIAATTLGLDEPARAQLWIEFDQVSRARWITIGVIASLLLCGLVALTPMARIRPPAGPIESVSPAVAEPQPDTPSQRAEPSAAYQIDLAALALLCTDLSRVTTPAVLPELLGRSAALLHASGLILWVDVGDRLVPVMGHGYSAHVMSRLGSALRTDDTAAAAAWRTGECTIVSGSDDSSGAVAVPLLGTERCMGVLAFEVSNGQQHNREIHAAASLIAAQLATVVAAPPPEATAEPVGSPADTPVPESQVQSA